MKAKSWITLAAIVLAVAGLGIYRSVSAPREEAAPEKVPEPGHGLPGILDFGKGECDACKRMMPVLDELAETHEGRIVVRYLDLNVPANKARADEMGVRLIPTQILIDEKGEEVIRHEGFWSTEDIELELEVLGWIPDR
ncbi:MAG: thioredoxin [Candidatus Latescibacteria bacterium]|nr:thioredoxin [Candidatus Latescibacterota bacterium]